MSLNLNINFSYNVSSIWVFNMQYKILYNRMRNVHAIVEPGKLIFI